MKASPSTLRYTPSASRARVQVCTAHSTHVNRDKRGFYLLDRNQVENNCEIAMSAFKRCPSKVFWDQMALHDPEDERFARRRDPPRYSFNGPFYGEEDEEEEAEEDEEEEAAANSISKSGNDDANITAIHVSDQNDQSLKREACRDSLTHDTSIASHRYVKEEIIKDRN